ncbi:MAG: MBL fold metallo-hydrolase [Kutzneria sp.]|nr:MBL fold metallo-hydrolase [Kutzneria sp.]
MVVHHLNCGSMREIEPVDGTGRGLGPLPLVCHCLLVETDSAGLVLVETGFGLLNVRHPVDSLGERFLGMAAPVLDPEQTAVRQVVALGYTPADVRHIVVTHLHRDHSGGLSDFPHATVHVSADEHRAATATSPQRYALAHWAHDPNWATYDGTGGEAWFSFETAHRLDGLPPDILMIPLAGHSPGHAAVAVRLDEDPECGPRWLLHAGDAYYHHSELEPDTPTPRELDAMQAVTETDRALRLGNLARLRALARDHADQVDIVCAHDPWEFQRYR